MPAEMSREIQGGALTICPQSAGANRIQIRLYNDNTTKMGRDALTDCPQLYCKSWYWCIHITPQTVEKIEGRNHIFVLNI